MPDNRPHHPTTDKGKKIKKIKKNGVEQVESKTKPLRQQSSSDRSSESINASFVTNLKATITCRICNTAQLCSKSIVPKLVLFVGCRSKFDCRAQLCVCSLVVNIWALQPVRPKGRGLAHHGGPPGWLEESDRAGCDFVRDGRSMPPALTGANPLLNVHKTPS
jgi:hypothetical protein